MAERNNSDMSAHLIHSSSVAATRLRELFAYDFGGLAPTAKLYRRYATGERNDRDTA